MASPASIREFRLLIGTTFNKTHSNAAESGWNAADGTATKLRITEYDDSGLVQENFQDETLQTRFHARPASHNGLRKGSYKIGTYCAGAGSAVAATAEENLMNIAAGGLTLPQTARTGVVQGSDSTTTSINVASIDGRIVRGQALLIGAHNDGRGGGLVYPVSAVSGNLATLSIACAVAPDAGDAVVYSSTVFPDEDATQQYVDHLAIGHGTADQRQSVGGVATFAISGMSPGELPKTEFEVQCADHQYVAATDRTTLTPATTPNGVAPAFGRGIGVVQIADHGSSTSSIRKAGDLSFSPGLSFEEIPDLSGVNGIGGYQHMPGTPTAECTVLVDEDFGLVADHNAQAGKTIVFQLGHTQGACMAIELPKCFIDKMPETSQLNNLQGMKISVHGDEDYVASNDIASAAWRVHKF